MEESLRESDSSSHPANTTRSHRSQTRVTRGPQPEAEERQVCVWRFRERSEHRGRGFCARRARVSFGVWRERVSLAYVPEAEVDDYVIVHAGFGISVLDEAEAMRTFEYLEQMEGSRQ